MSREQPILHIVPLPQKYTLDLALQSFLLDCQARHLSPKTIAYYRQDLAAFLAFLRTHNATAPGDIIPDLIRRFLVHLQESHNPGGVHGHFRAVRAFLRFLVREGELENNPLDKVAAPKLPKTILEPVPLDYVQQMLKACNGAMAERDKAIILCLLDSGLRAQELLSLNVSDIDLASGRVLVHHGKGNKSRIVFLGAKARKSLLRYLKTRLDLTPSQPLWLADNGQRLGYSGLVLMLRRRAKQAGVPAPSPHDFRRAYALLSLRNGCDVYSLQKLMGHSDLAVLRRYLAQTEDDVRRAHERTSPVDRML